jgi:hypothetical protein
MAYPKRCSRGYARTCVKKTAKKTAKKAAKKTRKRKELIPGGLASGMSPKDFDQKQLARGTKVEMEHTTSKRKATEIAMDHLVEDPKYYIKLAKMEKPERPASTRAKSELFKVSTASSVGKETAAQTKARMAKRDYAYSAKWGDPNYELAAKRLNDSLAKGGYLKALADAGIRFIRIEEPQKLFGMWQVMTTGQALRKPYILKEIGPEGVKVHDVLINRIERKLVKMGYD